jgi:hypothetical protein
VLELEASLAPPGGLSLDGKKHSDNLKVVPSSSGI